MESYLVELQRRSALPTVLQAADEINQVLRSNDASNLVHPQTIRIGDKVVLEDPPGALSAMLRSELLPDISEPTEVYHFTPHGKKILKERQLRLTCLTKRSGSSVHFPQGELATLIQSIGLPEGNTDDAHIDKLASCRFYTSFSPTTITDEQQQSLLRFGQYRLHLRINPRPPFQFHKVKYAQSSSDLAILKMINERFQEKWGLQLCFFGWSNGTNFYLPSTYQDENEYRLLVDTNFTSRLEVSMPEGETHSVINITLGAPSSGELIELLETTDLGDPEAD